MPLRLVTLYLVLALCSTPTIGAQQSPRTRTLSVTIVDSAQRRPVSGARLTFGADTLLRTVSDTRGIATFNVPNTADTLVVRAMGFARFVRYIPRSIEDALFIDVVLAPPAALAQELPAVATVDHKPADRLSEFEHRRTSGANGVFITRDDIVHRSPVRATDLFRALPGLRVVDSASLKLIVANRSYTPSLVSRSAPGGYCVVPIAVDGLLREGSFQIDLIDPTEIHGVEIYTSPGSIPPAYSSMQKNAWCGLILVWTRNR